ncbi:DNA (cytosine-5-)-methyltransferase [Treponema phagedenis F0421]|uniref:DNA-methyltransferase n=1 Tax=Treponema phagedenis TaxID=162 RepID=UPI0001F642E4|nr:site-specific DNA-methyltransferase [Treponema phagedenis]EFW38920.1 DNA (cytosine-5-)-methyltransferase [Treponema phagedenis F0421]
MYTVTDINKALLIHGDCFQKMKEIPDTSIDLILCDPPYNLAEYSTGNMKFDWRAEINNDVAEWDLITFDPQKLVEDFTRILKPKGNIFIFTSYNLIGKYHEIFNPIFDTFQFMVWHKTNPIPNVRKSSFLNSCELIVCLWNKGHTWNFSTQNQMHNFIETPICMGKERIKNPKHPTQKPLAVLEHIIKIASNENDIVFDPFMGVGSTGHAALNLNRRFLGIEIDKKYFAAACDRLTIFQQELRKLNEGCVNF